MDIPCPFCGEPWDQDALHEMPGVTLGMHASDVYDSCYREAVRQFRTYGCPVFQERGRRLEVCTRANLGDMALVHVLWETLGEDIDALSAEYEGWR